MPPAAPEQVLVDGGNVAFVRSEPQAREVWVTALGEDPVRVAGLVVAVAAGVHVDGVTVPDAAFDELPPRLQSPDPGRWSLWELDRLDPSISTSSASSLELDDPRIAPLVAHSTSAYVLPGDPRVRRWVGVQQGGELLSVAGMLQEDSGAAHLVSVCTAPAARGRGLARIACAAICESAIADGAPAVVLEMYADNEAGRRTYRAVGFAEVGTYRSGLLRPAHPASGPAPLGSSHDMD